MSGKSKTKKQNQTGRTLASPGVQHQYVATHQCVGIDVSDETLDNCLAQKDINNVVKVKSTCKCSNTRAGLTSLITKIRQKLSTDLPIRVVMEATGTYYELAAHVLHEAGFEVIVALPNKTYNFSKTLNEKSKNDRKDAKVLAQYGLTFALEAWQPPNPKILNIRQLSRERDAITKEIVKHRNQLHAESRAFAPNKDTLKRHKNAIAFLEKQISQIEKEISQLVKSDVELNEAVQRISMVPGLGTQTVITVIAETNGFGLIENKSQLESYCGYDIVQNDSGTSVRGKTRISKKGNSRIRSALYMPSLSAMRVKGEMQDYYHRIHAKHPKEGKKTLVAVQRKLLIIIYALYKNKTEYDPEYKQRKQAEQQKKQAAFVP